MNQNPSGFILCQFEDGYAIAAGFDGIELRGTNDYLINQFIDFQANQQRVIPPKNNSSQT